MLEERPRASDDGRRGRALRARGEPLGRAARRDPGDRAAARAHVPGAVEDDGVEALAAELFAGAREAVAHFEREADVDAAALRRAERRGDVGVLDEAQRARPVRAA